MIRERGRRRSFGAVPVALVALGLLAVPLGRVRVRRRRARVVPVRRGVGVLRGPERVRTDRRFVSLGVPGARTGGGAHGEWLARWLAG
jgi:hypothetical protein